MSCHNALLLSIFAVVTVIAAGMLVVLAMNNFYTYA
jgi:hypothetical protein